MVCAVVNAAQNELHKTSATPLTLFMIHLTRFLPGQTEFLSAGSTRAISLGDPADVCVHVRVRVGQPPQMDRRLARIICGCDQSQVSVELSIQPGQVCDAALDVLLNAKTISHSKSRSRLGH